MPITYQVIQQAHATVPVGEVISQDPEETGIPLDPNDDIVITLYVSTGPSMAAKARASFSNPSFVVATFS